MALHYGVTDEPALFAATNVADAVVGTLRLAGLVVLVHLLHRIPGTRPVSLDGLGMLASLAFGSLRASQRLSGWAAESGVRIPAIRLAPVCRGDRGSCDLEAQAGLGRIGGLLVLFVVLALLIHGLVQFGAGRLLRLSPETLAIASSANVGGALGTYAGFLSLVATVCAVAERLAPDRRGLEARFSDSPPSVPVISERT